MKSESRPHVVIIGGGFAGLYAARTLKKAPVRITLLDRRNHHLFQPLLYQVATAALNPSDIAAPIRGILHRQKNASVIMADVRSVDVVRRKVVLEEGEVGFDYLIVATGATHSYFGHDEWATLAPGLKTIEDALEIRRRILLAFEAAERAASAEERKTWLTFVVVGAGPTGVELAGALTEIARHTLARDFRHFDPHDARVILVEGLPHVLQTYPESLSEKARRQLEDLGVEVLTGARVTSIDAGGVSLDEKRISARTVLWAAGVTASPLGRSLGAPLDRAGRVEVNPDLSIPGSDVVFVAGDLAALRESGKAVPGVAPAAIQEGKHAAENIERMVRGKRTRPFHYFDKGSLATIGRAAAVADIGPLKLSGFIAWMAWLVIHIFFLIGFRNRFFVIVQWAWAYLTFQRGARLITGSVDEALRTQPPYVDR